MSLLTKDRTLYIKSTEKLYLEKNEAGIEIHVDFEGLTAIAFQGKSKKPSFHYRYKTREELEKRSNEWFNEFVKRYEKNLLEKKEKKKAQSELDLTAEGISIGTILHNSWGYEQTQCEWYQVTEIKGKRLFVKRICGSVVEGSQGHDCCDMMPIKDKFLLDDKGNCKDERWTTVKVKIYSGSGTSFSGEKYLKFTGFESFDHVTLWDGNAKYCSWGY